MLGRLCGRCANLMCRMQEQQICVKHTDSAPTLLQLCLSVAGRAMGDLLGAANDESRIFATGFKGARVQAHTTQHILIQPTSSSPHGQRRFV
jgi:hypothetical protein